MTTEWQEQRRLAYSTSALLKARRKLHQEPSEPRERWARERLGEEVRDVVARVDVRERQDARFDISMALPFWTKKTMVWARARCGYIAFQALIFGSWVSLNELIRSSDAGAQRSPMQL